MRILIVEDERHLAEALRQIMLEQKYKADIVYDGEDGFEYAMSNAYDAIILDIMLPGQNGFEVVRKLRAEKNNVPILLLTAKDEISDKVKGLDCGADDYMTKPFSPEELLARIRAMMRRQGDVVFDEIKFANLSLNISMRTLNCGEKSMHLAYKEFEILRLLINKPKVIVPKEDIIIKVWGADAEADDNNVEAYISFLRKKLNFLGSEAKIKTIRKVGYRLEEKDD
ncbi:MAG: DNA-binding response regulator [Clostridiales bacterium]|nr:MAG: DNA-binding response regulator [Clostridiales bacterium]